jgi:hypothetical protein
MKDNQVKKLTRVVRKLAAEVAALRKLIRRDMRTRDRATKGRKEKKGKSARNKKGSREDAPPSPAA